MACDITSGWSLGCRDNAGGIKSFYILSGSVTSYTEASAGLIDGITGTGVFYQYDLFRETSDFAENVVVTPENGTVVYEQTLNASFFKMQVALRNQIKVLAQNPNLKVIIETNNLDNTSKYVYIGEYNGLQLLSTTGGTGTAFGDKNGYTLSFTGREPEPARFIEAANPTELAALMTGITLG
jgi:hypothetical protein